ncbi:MAG: autotransporter domain-containing protein, partial [Hyphomicrobiales bacterium]|nr:autotransporter domain-containing protein [Hyphomicrobiales bacterium]
VAAIDVSGATGATMITQSSGTISGAIKLSGNADTLTVNGGNIFGDIVGMGTRDTLSVDPTNNANNIFSYGNTISGIAAINLAAKANLALTMQGVLENSGVLTLAPTARISGNGSFTQTSSGTTALQVTNNTTSGAFPTITANAITLSGKLQVVLTGAFPASGMEDFVKVFAASSSLANNIAAENVSVVTSGAMLATGTSVTARLVQSGNAADVVLTEAANPPRTGVGQTPMAFPVLAGQTRNEAAVAAALNLVLARDTAASQPLLFAVLHAPRLSQALDALSGELHASVVTGAFEDTRLPREAILDHLSLQLTTTSPGSDSDAVDSHSGKTVSPALIAGRLSQPSAFDFWGQGFGDWGHAGSDGNAASTSRSTGGLVLGGDVFGDGYLGTDWRFGLAGGYTNDHLAVSQRLSSATFESGFGGAYAGASFGAAQIGAGALYAANSTATTREVMFPGFASATASNNGGSTVQAFGEAGYRINLSGASMVGLTFRDAALEPFVGAAGIRIHQSSFTEVGDAAALTGAAKDFNFATTILGIRGELTFAAMPVTFTTTLGWRHALGDLAPSVLLGFQGGAQSFTVAAIPVDRDALAAEVGANYRVTTAANVGFSYSGQFGRRDIANAFKGHLILSF